jgi:hypothetical protein
MSNQEGESGTTGEGSVTGDAGSQAGVISKLGVLDLTAMRSPDDLAKITRIEQVGVVLAPESLVSHVMQIPMHAVGGTVAVPEGANVRVIIGNIKLGGEALAAPTSDGDVLVVVGQLILTSPVESAGNVRLIVAGQILAPKGSEAALGAAITRLMGQTVYYTGEPRLFTGSDRFARGFFEYLEQPVTLVLAGNFAIEPDTPVDLVKQKVAQIVLAGTLKAARDLVPLLQALATEKAGTIVAFEDAAAAADSGGDGDDENGEDGESDKG